MGDLIMQLPYTKGCFVCGAQNPHGLALRFRIVGNEVHGDFTPQPQHAGFRGIIHGGIVSTVLDEVMIWAAAVTMKRFCVAADLNVRFLKRVSVGQPYLLVGKLEADRGRIWESSGELRDATGLVYARATSKQVPLKLADLKSLTEDFLPDPATATVAALFPDLIS